MAHNSALADHNRQWVIAVGGIIVTIFLGVGAFVGKGLQSQIDYNRDKIYEVKSTSVSQERLDAQIQNVMDYIDVRIQSLESQQREISRQLTILVEDTKEFRSYVRDNVVRRNPTSPDD
ncbi:MAG: hypothetical protein CMF22_10615 [Idiomarinaceae bacterium]|nr:hypothetical protein [Idiomarinaceae bacterium]MBG23893.1 hypothetical protein [Idiomarinaceae bacterium]|tara:strand:+ start:9002 stop:9358 length:357 start_codon:yes stop_codon:yes gene_type:complete